MAARAAGGPREHATLRWGRPDRLTVRTVAAPEALSPPRGPPPRAAARHHAPATRSVPRRATLVAATGAGPTSESARQRARSASDATTSPEATRPSSYRTAAPHLHRRGTTRGRRGSPSPMTSDRGELPGPPQCAVGNSELASSHAHQVTATRWLGVPELRRDATRWFGVPELRRDATRWFGVPELRRHEATTRTTPRRSARARPTERRRRVGRPGRQRRPRAPQLPSSITIEVHPAGAPSGVAVAGRRATC